MHVHVPLFEGTFGNTIWVNIGKVVRGKFSHKNIIWYLSFVASDAPALAWCRVNGLWPKILASAQYKWTEISAFAGTEHGKAAWTAVWTFQSFGGQY